MLPFFYLIPNLQLHLQLQLRFSYFLATLQLRYSYVTATRPGIRSHPITPLPPIRPYKLLGPYSINKFDTLVSALGPSSFMQEVFHFSNFILLTSFVRTDPKSVTFKSCFCLNISISILAALQRVSFLTKNAFYVIIDSLKIG